LEEKLNLRFNKSSKRQIAYLQKAAKGCPV
jgi:hypothetical protein